MLQRKIKVLVATPLGEGGQGGIDRLMDSVRRQIASQPPEGFDIRFAPTRGQGHVAFSPFVLMRFMLGTFDRPDVIHINISSYGSSYRKLILAAWCRARGIPYVLHLHGSMYRKFWKEASDGLDKKLTRLYSQAAAAVVLGEVWRAFISSRAPKANVVVVPNATARPTLPHVPGSSVRILFLGKIGQRKGTFDLIEAFARMKDTSGWTAIVAGNGDVEKARQRIEELGLADRVSVPGWVGPDDVPAMIAKADILTLPSYDENLPMSVIEGMAAGLAVVATPVGAVEDIITDGETGLLVTPGDVPALANALTRLVEDSALRAEIGKKAVQIHREKLDLEPYIGQLTAVWRDAVAKNTVGKAAA